MSGLSTQHGHGRSTRSNMDLRNRRARYSPGIGATLTYLAVTALGCGKVEAANAKAEASRVAAAHLGDVRALATHVSGSCTLAPSVSPAKGTPIDADPDVLQVTIRCGNPAVTINGAPLWVTAPPLRKATPPGGAYYSVGVGKDAAVGVGSSSTLEEYVNVPSTLVAGANDLCIHEETKGVDVCVAYRAR